MLNYFLYVRKSTDVEDKQVRSIEDQLAVLRSLAKEQNLNVVCELVEKQSAKCPGRPVFNDMASRIQKGEATGIICWKLDRLARNPVDAAQIQWLLQEGTIQHIQTHDRSYRSADNVMLMNVEFGIANQYIRDLSVNTKRGLMEKARRGEYPGLAPLGYLNDVRNKSIVIDQHKGPIIKQAFERYSQGLCSLENTSGFLFERGIMTKQIQKGGSKGGKLFKRDQAKYILSNPFYCGLFRYGGELFQGKHESLISKQLFDKVQEVLKQRGKTIRKPAEGKPLAGLLRCGECGRNVTGETHIKKSGLVFTYYRCTKKRTVCSQPFIRDGELASQLSNTLKTFIMPKEWAEELLSMAEKDSQEANQTTTILVQDLGLKKTDIDRRLQKLKDMYLDQDIEQEEYRTDKNNLVSQKKSLEEQMTKIEQGSNFWLEPYKQWLKDAEKLGEITLSPELHPKKSAAQKIFGSNLFLKNRQLQFSPQTQWAALSAALEKVDKIPLCNILVPGRGLEPPWV